MNITLKIYIASKGDGSTIFEDTFQADTFDELVESSKNVWVNAKNDGLIESNNDLYVATSKAWPFPCTSSLQPSFSSSWCTSQIPHHRSQHLFLLSFAFPFLTSTLSLTLNYFFRFRSSPPLL